MHGLGILGNRRLRSFKVLSNRGTKSRMGWTSFIGCPTSSVTSPLKGTAEAVVITAFTRVPPVVGGGTPPTKGKEKQVAKHHKNAYVYSTRKEWKQTVKGTNRRGPYHIITK